MLAKARRHTDASLRPGHTSRADAFVRTRRRVRTDTSVRTDAPMARRRVSGFGCASGRADVSVWTRPYKRIEASVRTRLPATETSMEARRYLTTSRRVLTCISAICLYMGAGDLEAPAFGSLFHAAEMLTMH